jgi:hypothetical protein
MKGFRGIKVKRLVLVSWAAVVFAMLLMAGCKYSNVEETYPINTCDTSNISYGSYIQPMLKTNCYSCHTAGNAGLGGNYVLDNYNDVAAQAKKGFLYGDISDPDLTSVSHMPRGLASMPLCDILKVKAWVNHGYKNN